MVACQKTQEWSLDQMRTIFINLKKSITISIPIGFTYVQLPHEKAPGEIWPKMIWKDVTEDYAGVFFRAAGGEAATFGQIQMENTKRIDKISSVNLNDGVEKNCADQCRNTTVPLHGPSKWFYTGNSPSGTQNFVSFELSDGEVRPKNMAMKIWRRIS